jgi:thymidylate synthase (FAD)
MGDDLAVVNAARVSFNKASEWEGYEKDGRTRIMAEGDKRLISYLAKHNHWSPFAHTAITMRVKIPIFLARQWFKHIVGSVKNEVSRRYVDTEPEFYMPEWRARPDKSIKQGSGELLTDETKQRCDNIFIFMQNEAEDKYRRLLRYGVAPEQARAVLPQSMYTEFVDTGSLVYWSRMYNLRTEATAQSEWGPLMASLSEQVAVLYPVSWEVLTNGSD